ncbi:hypothetical protein RCL1_004238 [Eukaryota sp. TZLM3-RCL]
MSNILTDLLPSNLSIIATLSYKDFAENFASIVYSSPNGDFVLILKEGHSIVAIDTSTTKMALTDAVSPTDFILNLHLNDRIIKLHSPPTPITLLFKQHFNYIITSSSPSLSSQLNSIFASKFAPGSVMSPKSAKSLWIRKTLRDRIPEYSTPHEISAFLTTFNVNSKLPSDSDSLSQWISFSFDSPDLIFIGLQEVDMGAATLIAQEVSSIVDPWIDKLTQIIGPDYRLLASKQLVGLVSLIFIKKTIPNVSDPICFTIGTGLMGRMGNKGAVITTLKIGDTNIALINSHLAASMNKVQRRIQDATDIITRFESILIERNNRSDLFSEETSALEPNSIYDFDYVFWIGDLNFRIELEHVKILELLKSNNLSEILKHDQLLQQFKNSDNIFSGFIEFPITFRPSYKYVPGTLEYIPVNSEKIRPPAYCDRCMYFAKSGNLLKSRGYFLKEFCLSDHLPVVSEVVFEYRTSEEAKKEVFFDKILAEYRHFQLNALPSLKVNSETINFGQNIKYGDPVIIRTVIITNTSPVVAFWSFPQNVPKYVLVSTNSGVLLPHQSQELSITLAISDPNFFSLLSKVHSSRELKDLLIIRVACGSSIALHLNASFASSYFGMDLSKQIKSSDGDRIPSALWSICNEIFTPGEGFMRHVLDSSFSDEFSQFINARNLIDNDNSLSHLTPPPSPQGFLFLLLHYLRCLPNSLVDPNILAEYFIVDDVNAARVCLSKLSSAFYTCTLYVLSFMREVVKYLPKEKCCLFFGLFASVLIKLPNDRVVATDYSLDVADEDDRRVLFLRLLCS